MSELDSPMTTDAVPPTPAGFGGEPYQAGVEPRRRGAAVLTTFGENKLALIGGIIVVTITAFCFVGPLLYRTNQTQANFITANLAPGGGHLLGTDNNGYDILGRLMRGGQSSLEVGFAVAIIASTIGVLYGAVAGFAGGAVDALMMRIVDAFLAIPVIFLFIYLSTVFHPSLVLLIVVLSLISWLGPARLIRGETLTLRTREYVQAVRLMGGGSARAIFRHIIPNAFGTIVVNATFQVADAILVLAVLTYLGFALPPPAATWGGMLSDGTTFLINGYWWEVYPALIVIVLTVVAFNFIGDGLRDALDVRLRQR